MSAFLIGNQYRSWLLIILRRYYKANCFTHQLEVCNFKMPDPFSRKWQSIVNKKCQPMFDKKANSIFKGPQKYLTESKKIYGDPCFSKSSTGDPHVQILHACGNRFVQGTRFQMPHVCKGTSVQISLNLYRRLSVRILHVEIHVCKGGPLYKCSIW